MSCFVVSTDHIDLLVSYAKRTSTRDSGYFIGSGNEGKHYEVISDGGAADDNPFVTTIEASDLGKLLLTQNVRSVLHRYEQADAKEVAGYSKMIEDYTFRQVELFRLEEVNKLEAAIIGACRCYNYQSCETGDLESTEAGAWCEAIYHKAANAISDRLADTWEWERGQA